MSISPRSYGHLTSLLATQLACWFFAENRVTLTAHTAFVDFIINTTPPTQDLADAHLCPSVLIPLNTQRGKSDPEGGGGGLHHHFGPGRGAGVPGTDPTDPSQPYKSKGPAGRRATEAASREGGFTTNEAPAAAGSAPKTYPTLSPVGTGSEGVGEQRDGTGTESDVMYYQRALDAAAEIRIPMKGVYPELD